VDGVWQNNSAELCGTPVGAPLFSHTSRGEYYYVLSLAVERLSGTVDTLNITVTRALLEAAELTEGERLAVSGEVRSFNNKSGVGSKLVISVFARELKITDIPEKNIVTLRGTLCKEPVFRRTPMGREICDIMLAVNRRCGRSDYIPCIAWGANAETAALWTTGMSTGLEGRLQSRHYIKITDGEAVDKIAYEVSVSSFFDI